VRGVPFRADPISLHATPGYVDTGECTLDHSGSGTYGENLYWSSGSGTTTLVPAVNSWYSEEPYWSCQNNNCQSNKSTNPPSSSSFSSPSLLCLPWLICWYVVCGHYTQVMWNNTQSVGCGLRTTCTGTYATMISCNYYPPGNYGQRPFPRTHPNRNH
jgi:pathogenesis-related protein 1